MKTIEKVHVSIIPFENHILGVVDGFVFIKTEIDSNGDYEDAVVKIPRAEYLRIINLWLDEKADNCKRWGHFCGVFGNLTSDGGEQIGEIDIFNEASIEDKTIKELKNVPLILVEKFEDDVDMEHG